MKTFKEYLKLKEDCGCAGNNASAPAPVAPTNCGNQSSAMPVWGWNYGYGLYKPKKHKKKKKR